MQIQRTALERFVHDGCESSFNEIVRGHVDLVYSVALRILEGHPDLAADVVQNVFIDFAARAPSMPSDRLLAPWFHRAARLAALAIRREEYRRERREEVAESIRDADNSTEEATWKELRPALDEALDELGEPERQALSLRFFQEQSYCGIGKSLGVTEDAARMRVNRALESLRERLVRRNITSTATALATLLTGHAITTAPPALVSTVVSTLLITATTTSSLGIMSFLTTPGIKLAASLVIAVSLAVPLVRQIRNNQHLRNNNSALLLQLETTRTQLQQARDKGASQLDEIAALNEAQAELRRLRGQVADLRRQIAIPTPAEPAKVTANPADRDESVVLKERPKALVFGEMSGIIPIPEGETLRVSEALASLPRSQFADLRRVRLYRMDPVAGAQTTNIVNVDLILREGDQTQDLVLKDGDRIEVRPRTFNF